LSLLAQHAQLPLRGKVSHHSVDGAHCIFLPGECCIVAMVSSQEARERLLVSSNGGKFGKFYYFIIFILNRKDFLKIA
jgi:hypothetical protein